MTEQELIHILDTWENIPLLINEINKYPENYELIMKIALYNKEHNSWRAAWMIDKIHEKFPELILPFINDIILQLKKEERSSKKRHFLKQISLNKIPEIYYGFLVDYCLEALTSAKEPPAVRVHAMQILFHISEIETDLKPEILAIIEHEMEYHASAGILSRGRKIAKKLHTQIQQNLRINF